MRDKVIAHLASTAHAHRELVAGLPEADLGWRLSERSNTIGAQIWCVGRPSPESWATRWALEQPG